MQRRLDRDAEDKRPMLEWVHQQTLPAIYRLPYHRTLLERIREHWETLPNVLFYGSHGFPLEYMAYGALSTDDTPPVKRVCLWDNKLPYTESERFFEIQGAHPDMPKGRDLEVLLRFLHHIVHTQCLHGSRHVILLRDIERLAQGFPMALRIFLERYSHNVLFIGTTHHLTKIDPPLRSRFMMVRVPQPHPSECATYLKDLKDLKDAPTPNQTLIEYLFRCVGVPSEDLSATALKTFMAQRPLPAFQEVRQMAHKCFQRGMTFPNFAKMLIQNVATKYKSSLVAFLASLEHQLARSSKGREPIYFEHALWRATYINTLS